MEFILFLLLGIGVGVFGSLVGIGGGLICVPVFIFFMSQGGIYPYFSTAAQITGTSLFIVLANAMSGALAYVRQKRVFFHAAIPFAPPECLTCITVSSLAAWLSLCTGMPRMQSTRTCWSFPPDLHIIGEWVLPPAWELVSCPVSSALAAVLSTYQ